MGFGKRGKSHDLPWEDTTIGKVQFFGETTILY
jgi:hypothetical protein